jgi:hypothetical protein
VTKRRRDEETKRGHGEGESKTEDGTKDPNRDEGTEILLLTPRILRVKFFTYNLSLRL